MQYSADGGFKALNEFYNYVGFGDTFDLTATDRIALNLLYPCQVMKKQILRQFLSEETFRNYVELSQLTITPNEKSQRSSLLYPPSLVVESSDPAVEELAGVYFKTDRVRDFRPTYRNE